MKKYDLTILIGLSNGETMKAIAAKIGISPRTVEMYIGKMLERWNCKNQTQLVAHALRSKIIV